jgi:hypothetical protein
MRRRLGSSDYSPTNTNPNMVDYIGSHACHHLGLPQLSVELGAISSNRKTRNHAYSIDYYSNPVRKTRALDASGDLVNKLETQLKK